MYTRMHVLVGKQVRGCAHTSVNVCVYDILKVSLRMGEQSVSPLLCFQYRLLLPHCEKGWSAN